ncbi:hypothetical protein IEQ34_019509 [Dendrobium chrysotoxum]|uniref:Uncharacterized protein n=1 Tax=Dendrobium chrysotoxum TaxID=161865 RepID=A0AAV7G8V4_DENCH|nr:hypothetical protein IEQ34_019509 [Dendrobium chrysotoxum]
MSLALTAVQCTILHVHEEEAEVMVCKVRCNDEIHEELQDLVLTSNDAKVVKHPWKNIYHRA